MRVSRDSTASTLAAILNQEPKPISKLLPGTPSDLEKIISRCLRKDQERRFQHMDDLKVALQELKEESDSGAPAGIDPATLPATLNKSHWFSKRRQLSAAGLVLSLLVAFLFWWSLGRPKAPRELALTRLTSDSGLTTDAVISPDGKLIAYASDRSGNNLDIYVKQVSGGDPIQLTRDPADDHQPAFSPDGGRIVFRSEREGGGIYIISALGGRGPTADSERTQSPILACWRLDRLLGGTGRRPSLWSPSGKNLSDISHRRCPKANRSTAHCCRFIRCVPLGR